MIKNRYLTNYIVEDLSEKMVFIGGARQVGKTTLSIDLIAEKFKNYECYFSTLGQPVSYYLGVCRRTFGSPTNS